MASFPPTPLEARHCLREPALDRTGVDGRKKFQVEYDAVDSVTKQWGPQRLTAASSVTTSCRGTARDVMVNGMFAAEGGYPLILTVHDELLAEVPESFGSVEEFKRSCCRRSCGSMAVRSRPPRGKQIREMTEKIELPPRMLEL